MSSGWIDEEHQREPTKSTASGGLKNTCGDIAAGITDETQVYTRSFSIPCIIKEGAKHEMSQQVLEHPAAASQITAVCAIHINISGQTVPRIVL